MLYGSSRGTSLRSPNRNFKVDKNVWLAITVIWRYNFGFATYINKLFRLFAKRLGVSDSFFCFSAGRLCDSRQSNFKHCRVWSNHGSLSLFLWLGVSTTVHVPYVLSIGRTFALFLFSADSPTSNHHVLPTSDIGDSMSVCRDDLLAHIKCIN